MEDIQTPGDGAQEVMEIQTAGQPAGCPSDPGGALSVKRAFGSLIERPPALTRELQVRMDAAAQQDQLARFVGYASTTGVPYEVRDWLGEYQETILPGAFAKTLREQGDIPLLFNHGGIPLASTGSGTSRLSEDKIGLRNEADLDRRDGLTNSICVQMERGVLNKMSFSFRGVKDTWNDTFDQRHVSEAALYDSSIVTYPANPSTTAELQEAMRSAMGREGRSLWLADSEPSIRSALPVIVRDGTVDPDTNDLLERALRALVHADEVLCGAHGLHGRARTIHVASAMVELRQGKQLSAKNEQLLKAAMSALAGAEKQHAKVAKSHAQAAEALNTVLNGALPADADSDDGDGQGAGNPISPPDAAGPRSSRAIVLKREREAELRALLRG
jgi:HK97 family phage prohead protease